MKKYLIIALALFPVIAYPATRTIDADFIRSTDRTKTWTPPSATDTLVGRTSSDTLTNKTLTSPLFTGMTAGSVYFAGASGLLTQDNSSLFFDNTNDRLGLGTTSPTGRLDVTNVADSIRGNIVLWGQGRSANSEWVLYDSPGGDLTFYNPTQAVYGMGCRATGGCAFGTYALSAANQMLGIKNNSGETTKHTLVLQNIASQTGDALRHFASDGTTVNSKIDAAGAATVSGLTVSGLTAGAMITDSSGVVSKVAPGTTGNVLTSNGSAWVSSAATTGTGPRSYVYLQKGTGHGSTNAKVRTYTNAVLNVSGSCITYNASATNGDNFTIASSCDGLYIMSMDDVQAGTNSICAITKNATGTDLTSTNVTSLCQSSSGTDNAKCLGWHNNDSGFQCSVTRAAYLVAGDVIRCQDNGGNAANAEGARCTIMRVGY